MSQASSRLYDLRVTVVAIGALGVWAGGGRLLRDRIQPGAHPRGAALLPVRAAIGYPTAAAKQRLLEAGDWLEQDNLVACPDPDERLIMKIERIARRTLATDDLT